MQEKITREDIEKIYKQPFMDLMFEAQKVHREYHDPKKIQWSTLLSVKTGSCGEDCKYCSQSEKNDAEIEKEKFIDVDTVIREAQAAKDGGSTRFCMGAAWKKVAERDMPKIEKMISEVKKLGLETCVTLGKVTPEQASKFKDVGLDYYNHNLDTSREHYSKVITTRTFDDRLDTIKNVRDAGINVCSGGILGLGEEENDRIGLLHELANMETPPESVPVNKLVAIKGTPLGDDENLQEVDKFDFVRFIATARIIMPKSYVRLSAGREVMSEEMQTLCIMAGANSWFTGSKLLTTTNPEFDTDKALLSKIDVDIEKLENSGETKKESCSSNA